MVKTPNEIINKLRKRFIRIHGDEFEAVNDFLCGEIGIDEYKLRTKLIQEQKAAINHELMIMFGVESMSDVLKPEKWEAEIEGQYVAPDPLFDFSPPPF